MRNFDTALLCEDEILLVGSGSFLCATTTFSFFFFFFFSYCVVVERCEANDVAI